MTFKSQAKALADYDARITNTSLSSCPVDFKEQVLILQAISDDIESKHVQTKKNETKAKWIAIIPTVLKSGGLVAFAVGFLGSMTGFIATPLFAVGGLVGGALSYIAGHDLAFNVCNRFAYIDRKRGQARLFLRLQEKASSAIRDILQETPVDKLLRAPPRLPGLTEAFRAKLAKETALRTSFETRAQRAEQSLADLEKDVDAATVPAAQKLTA